MYAPKGSKVGATWQDLGSSGVQNSGRFRMLECMLQKGRRSELRGRTSRVQSFAWYIHNNMMRNLAEG
jgi:hypothetical protein